jgi:hypothetical protein
MEGGRAMSNINDLFCTPDQGRRLKELVPELQFSFVWGMQNKKTKLMVVNDPPMSGSSFVPPALTLQELRDVVSKLILDHMGKGSASIDNDEFEYNLSIMTAPNLAAWIIERLEGTV